MNVKKYFTREYLLSDVAILVYLAILKFIIQLIPASNYGFFRDELYYIATSEHLDFGYVDIPPLVPIFAAMSRVLLGDSLFAFHVFPALTGALTVFLTGMIARKLGGGRFAQILSAVAFIASPGFLGQNSIFSYDSFDLLFSAAFFFVLITILKDDKPKRWLLFGFIAGIGLMTKLSMLFLGFALVIALLITPARKQLKSKYIYLGGLIALLLCLPYILWQIAHGGPILKYWSYYAQHKTYHASPLEFLLNQIITANPFSLPLWMMGLCYYLFHKESKPFRTLGLMYVILAVLFILMHMKYYLLSPFYPMLFASGAVWIEQIASRKRRQWLKPVYICVLSLSGLLFAPFAIPILPVQTLVKIEAGLSDIGKTENIETAELPPNFADRFGWETMVSAVAQVYNDLSEEERSKCFILTTNYGEAGAVDFLGKKYGLPKSISGHLSYYFWGPRDFNGDIAIEFGCGVSEEHLKKCFSSVVQSGIIRSEYAIPYETNLPIFVCRDLQIPIEQLWLEFKNFS